MESKSFVTIDLNYIEEGLQLTIFAKVDKTLFEVSDASENGEEKYQLLEGFSYDYEFNISDFEFDKSSIIQPHSQKKYRGIISPNIFVGTLSLSILKDTEKIDNIHFEVRSLKAKYREDYRLMLGFITEKCTDLLMHANSPVSHNFETDFNKDNETLYQKFVFIRSIISTEEFSEAAHRIVTSPVTRWKETIDHKDVRNVHRFKNSNIKELIKGSRRIGLPENQFLRKYGFSSIPLKISSVRKSETVDTPENRFVKFALERFLNFCSGINKASKIGSQMWHESGILEKKLESILHHSIFKEISHPETLRLNSPVLQRKEGYREILRVWLMFDLAAKLVWKGGDDVYSGGKKDVATLYEYWLFFKLLDLFKSIFEIEPKDISRLIKTTDDGLNIQLKQGNHTALKGLFNTGTRILNVRFNYNRKFHVQREYSQVGSWTIGMRPDYTLSIWPGKISEEEAESQELIVHIHFDAKYKIANLIDLLNNTADEDFDSEKEENRKGIYKNADLLKMHAYKDAIRRTSGAYVLYPGEVAIKRMGFHEIIPGLGAFPVSPSSGNDGISELKDFILEVLKHFENRASQREKIAYHTNKVYKTNLLEEDEVREVLPETYGINRGLIPDETFVLIGFYKQEDLDWIIKSGIYYTSTENHQDSIIIGPGEVSAKYLLLHTIGETKTGRLVKINEGGPSVYSKQKLLTAGYPAYLSQAYYFVYKIQNFIESEFMNHEWDISLLDKYNNSYDTELMFSVTMTELMKTKILKNQKMN